MIAFYDSIVSLDAFSAGCWMFSHMTSKILLDSGSVPDGGESSSSSVEAKEHSEAFEKTVDLQSTTEEIEKSLEELGSSIEETTRVVLWARTQSLHTSP